ncbi:hypothetical protein SCHPADRAFT_947585 [Schizopora paradoxa]|uniref:DUF6533 domain-containing protein n=1 Tax=Schizopora paradoxa TaxID=27342 RepID=A0A0H2R542_9AGAM|nr:hypothetical protein SCHPADRAFT_947585 [Schizopora paradoxa]
MSDLAVAVIQRQSVYYYTLASFVICYYDYFLTLDDEIRYFWRRKFGLTAFLFFLNRYTQFLGTIPVVILTFARLSDKGFQPYHHYFVVFTLIVGSLILILRTYALYGGSRKVLYTLAMLWVIAVGIGIWTIMSRSTVVKSPVDVLFPNVCLEPSYNGQRLALTWIVVFTFDSVVFGLTMFKVMTSSTTVNGRSRLLTRIVRDGAAYYVILGVVYLSNIITSLVAPPALQDISVWFANV